MPQTDEIMETKPARLDDNDLGFWPVDWCHMVFLVGSVVLFMVIWDPVSDPVGWSLLDTGLIVLLLWIVKKTPTWTLGKAAMTRMAYCMLTIPLIFTQLGSLVPYVNPSNWEEKLYRFDRALFMGNNPLHLVGHMSNPWLTEVLQWVYNYYYFIAIVVGIAVVKKKQPRILARLTFCFVLCIYVSYIGYYIVPASGPNIDKYNLYEFGERIQGVYLASEMRETMYFIEKIKQDCFPSGHTAVALLALLLAKRYAKKLVPILAPLVVALIFSTVYLRYHYVADVLAGIILAYGSAIFGIKIHERFERSTWGNDGNESGTS